MQRRGLRLATTDNLRGKSLLWDGRDLVVTSFNWFSTVVEGTRSRVAEIGIYVSGLQLREMLEGKLARHHAREALQSALACRSDESEGRS